MKKTTRDEIARLIELDAAGFFARDGETPDELEKRIRREQTAPCPFDAGKNDVPIPPDILAEAGEITRKHYAFSRQGDRGFFVSRRLGLFCGGCAVWDTSNSARFFLLRRIFAERKKWLVFRRDELLAHELCHLAREAVGDEELEEFFAYRISFSAFRRTVADALSTERDVFFFLVALFLLLGASAVKAFLFPGLPITLFYLLLAGVISALALRTWRRNKTVGNAAKNLTRFGILMPFAVLFRSNVREIREIAGMKRKSQWHRFLAQKEKTSLRWLVIKRRFCRS
ncbi:MAG: hypothetical protein MJ016_03375 [Victivallaceae bacterium]|nr:hypothetical protein [Victivallaceae bacterium]